MNFIISEVKPGSCPQCEHCHSDSNVSQFLKTREEMREAVIQEAKNFFGSINRDDTTLLLEAVGKLLIHENHC